MLIELRHAEQPDPVTSPDPIQYFLLKIQELRNAGEKEPKFETPRDIEGIVYTSL